MEIKKLITVGVVGLPNVGKISLINSLRRCHVVNIGATPRLTRSMQEVQLDKNVKLLDCPGVVMARSGERDASTALRNYKKIEKLEDPAGPGKILYYTMPPTRDAGVPSEAKIISELGKEFNIDEVYGTESFIGSLKSIDDFQPAEVLASGPYTK